MAMVSRNPFARTELHKRTVKATADSCRNCGGLAFRKVPGKPVKGYLFEYWNESDGGRKYVVSGRFCSVGCMRSYHNI